MTPEIGFDDAQLAFREAVASFCRQRLASTPPGELAPFDRGAWRELAALGVLGLPDPGGEGGALELVAASEALGAHLHPGPLAETVFAAAVLPPPLREAVVAGEAVVAVGVAPLFPYGPVADVLLEWDPATDEVHRVEPREPLETVAVLGDEPFGRSCLMARRLIESGVTFVEVRQDGWDTHADNFRATKRLGSEIDRPWAQLMLDLDARGLLKETLIVWMGEFGRTPAVNGRRGRDHFPRVTPVVLAGGGISAGTVIGATNEDGTDLARERYGVPDLFATMLTALGIEPDREYTTAFGSPTSATDDGDVIPGLL